MADTASQDENPTPQLPPEVPDPPAALIELMGKMYDTGVTVPAELDEEILAAARQHLSGQADSADRADSQEPLPGAAGASSQGRAEKTSESAETSGARATSGGDFSGVVIWRLLPWFVAAAASIAMIIWMGNPGKVGITGGFVIEGQTDAKGRYLVSNDVDGLIYNDEYLKAPVHAIRTDKIEKKMNKITLSPKVINKYSNLEFWRIS